MVVKDFRFIFEDDPFFFQMSTFKERRKNEKEKKIVLDGSILCPSAPTNESTFLTFFNTTNMLLPCSYLECRYSLNKRNKKFCDARDDKEK